MSASVSVPCAPAIRDGVPTAISSSKYAAGLGSVATAVSSECGSRAEANRGARALLLLQQPHTTTLNSPRRNVPKRADDRLAVAAQLGHERVRLAVVQVGRAPRQL